VTVSLDALRVEVAESNAAIDRAGLVSLSFGNVSGVDRDSGVLVIKPSGAPYATLRPEDLVVVSLADGRVVEGYQRPSVDTPTHRVLYEAFPEIGGIVHTHSPYAAAWAQAGRAIPCFGTTHADFFRGDVPVTRALRSEELGDTYEEDTGRAIVETLERTGQSAIEASAVLVVSHGPFVWGVTASAAVEAAIALETIAAMAFRTLVIEASTSEIGGELLARHFDRKHGTGAYYGQPDR
jgi:L-ribulose-5-phosphate 4-epimerase